MTCLVRHFGKSAEMKILGFFFENSFDRYDVDFVSDILKLNRTTTNRVINDYHSKELLLHDNGQYYINFNNDVILSFNDIISYLEKEYRFC